MTFTTVKAGVTVQHAHAVLQLGTNWDFAGTGTV